MLGSARKYKGFDPAQPLGTQWINQKRDIDSLMTKMDRFPPITFLVALKNLMGILLKLQEGLSKVGVVADIKEMREILSIYIREYEKFKKTDKDKEKDGSIIGQLIRD